MGTIVFPLSALFGSIGILLLGNGLLGTLLGLRAMVAGYSVEVTGLVMSAYFAGFILGSVRCVRFIERAGHIRTFAALASIASAAALAHALFIFPLAWGILRAITGFCFAGLYMVTESWLNERSTNADRGQVLSVYMMVNLVALALGQFFLMTGEAEDFELFCLVSILVSIGLVPVTLTDSAAPAPPRFEPMSLVRLFKLSPVGITGSFAAGLALGAFWALTPVFCARLGMEERATALFMATTIMGGLVFLWPIGRLSDRIDRRWVVSLACVGTALASAALAMTPPGSFLMLLGLTAAFGGLVFPIYSIAVAHTNDHLEHGSLVSASSSLLIVYGAGAILGPIAGGMAIGWLGPGGLYFCISAIMAAMGIYAAYRIGMHGPIPVEEREAVVMVPRTTHVAYELDPRVEPSDTESPEEPCRSDQDIEDLPTATGPH